MGLTTGTLRELRSELANLRRQRGEVDARIRGIELVVSPRAGDAAELRKDHGRHGSAVDLLVVARRQRGTKGSLGSKLTAMLHGTKGLKTAELSDRLHREGFRVGGATGLRARVSHELSRLRRLKVVRRRRGGRYTLAAEKARDEAAASPKQEVTEAVG